MSKAYQKEIVTATPATPCPHCNKPDWCYRLGDLSVCNRDAETATGWYKTNKADKDGHYFYAPERNKSIAPKQDRVWEYCDRQGQAIARYHRIDYDNGRSPIKFQESYNGDRWIKGLKGTERSQIPVYRYPEIRAAIARGETIYIVAGEKCADLMWSIGLAATTNFCGEGKWKESDTKDLDGATQIVICPDNDRPGIKHAYLLGDQFPNAKYLYLPPSIFYWLTDNIPVSGGLDVGDYIESGADKDTIISAVTDLDPEQFSKSLPLYEQPDPSDLVERSEEVIIEAEEIFTQKAVDCLYGDSAYLAIHDKIYKYNGTHYELCSTPRERRRILEWCKTTPQETRGKWYYSLAKPETVDKIWRWVLTSFAVDPEEINPPGINCLNGVLQITWQGKKVNYKLVSHTPDFYFTHVANFAYDPNADDSDCNRLLAALDDTQQKIFLRTIAASIDLSTIRKYQGRAVKALLCTGTGSNGKDTLREAVKNILGAGMSSASVTDFQQYDQGRKFPAAKIEHSLINWSSENSEFACIDKLQGLKAAITGEDFDIEPKNAAEYSITPRTVFLFNCNSAPLLQGGTEAIASRWAVLSFRKTFKTVANPALGELQADSRFRYDPEFLDTHVCPALLNKILVELQNVAIEGIDYTPIDEALTKIQEESNHLWQFINDVGIERSPADRLYISDLWRSLEKWYVDNGTLEYERVGDRLKKVWHDQARISDRNVTASNQVGKRLRELFPDLQMKRHTERDGSDRMGKAYILGLAIAAEASAEAETSVGRAAEDAEAKVATLARLVTEIKLLPSPERLTAIKIMNDFVQSETNLEVFASASSAADYERDSASALASADNRERSPERSPMNVTATNSKNSSDHAVKSANNHLPFNITNNVSVEVNQDSDVTSNEHPPIDWIKDKAGEIWQIDSQDGDILTGHKSGTRGYAKIPIQDVAEFNYVKNKSKESMYD